MHIDIGHYWLEMRQQLGQQFSIHFDETMRPNAFRHRSKVVLFYYKYKLLLHATDSGAVLDKQGNAVRVLCGTVGGIRVVILQTKGGY